MTMKKKSIKIDDIKEEKSLWKMWGIGTTPDNDSE